MVGFSDVTVVLTLSGREPFTVVDRLKVEGLAAYEGRVYFSARSGGESSDHDLDNVSVQFVSLYTAVLSFSAAFSHAVESDSTASLNIVRSGDAAGTASVQYVTADLSAASGADHQASSGTLIFSPGETSKSLTVSLLDDDLNEGDEAFLVALLNPTAPRWEGRIPRGSTSLTTSQPAREDIGARRSPGLSWRST